MIISHAHKFIFLKTQKTGGSSVQLALSEICGPEDVVTALPAEDMDFGRGSGPRNIEVPEAYVPLHARVQARLGRRPSRVGLAYHQHMNATWVRKSMNPGKFDAYTKVSIVRNPWDREVSLYYWATRNDPTPPNFDKFVRRSVRRPERKTFEIYSINGVPVFDIMMRYETLEEDFRAFVNTLKVPNLPTLPRAKGAYRKPTTRDYRELYSDETIELVRKRNAREIDLFQFTFD
ncbi:MAG: hypothetical protein GKR99_15860 [Rhodobacteraceae bacterium]|nr:hypothetical protein [Paracoccaceae bacterium]